MKISQMRSTIVTVPFTRPEVWARGARPCVTNVIVELETDDGLVGLGECGVSASATVQSLSRYVIGADPFDLLERLKQRLRWSRVPMAFCAVEMAVLDLQGKALGLPLYRLLGGAVRRKVPFMYYLLRDKPEVMAREAAAAVKAGFSTIYIKVGIEIDEDIEVIQAVREAIGPRPKFRIDPNESWTVGTAVRLLRRLQDYDLELVEDPVSREDLAGWRRLRACTSVPIAAQENAHTLTDMFRVIKEDAADIILVDPFRNGGLSAMKHAAAMVEAAGLPVYVHSEAALGIATAALTHTLATIPNNLLANQTYYQFLGGDVVKERMDSFENGCLTPSERPGLGVTLDMERVSRFHEVYVRGEVVDGAYRREDMRQEASEDEAYYPRF
ncbi:MAG: mandelate racemase/muconate lactonizing enzyme family protein [Anaerolineae bacterium]|nr:mandelate racemase/muconate lactonizing enzyme family protein [Anaerolineae bacterium]